MAHAYNDLARLYKQSDNNDEAANLYQKAIVLIQAVPAQKRGPAHWAHLGQSLYYTGQMQKAREALEECIALGSDEGPTLLAEWWYLAMTLHELGETQLAREYFDQLVKQMEESSKPTPSDTELRAEAAAVLGVELAAAGNEK